MSDNRDRVYACIDLKSFYASVECAERGLNPFTTNLVVADPDRHEGTICLAITPAMKRLGVPNRCRVFEIPRGIKYIMAKPRMRLYMQRSADVYSIYLKYISPDDIHVYSIDECFIDLAPYVKLYKKSAYDITAMLMRDVERELSLYSAAGIGTNLFLAKVALDIQAKKSPDGIAYLDEEVFKSTVAHHRPITDIWNIGPGTARRLARMGAYDLAGVADIPDRYLHRAFGVNAEYIIDHANGRENCTMRDIKEYKPKETSISNSQVLFEPYSFSDARIVLTEMIEDSVLLLVSRHLAASRISLRVGYNYTGVFDSPSYHLPPPTGASMKLAGLTNSLRELTEYFDGIYERTTDKSIPIRNLAIGFEGLAPESFITADFFTDTVKQSKERALLGAIVDIKDKYGKNAIVKGASFEPKATARERNLMVGGHNG